MIVSTRKKTSMFICMPKVNFIIHFFLEILHFKEFDWPTAFWPITRELEFCHNNNISFHFRLFPGKTKDEILGAILGPFPQNFGKNEFYWKKGLCQFLNIPIMYHHAKNQKKTNDPFLRKMLNWRKDGRTDKKTDRQTMMIL